MVRYKKNMVVEVQMGGRWLPGKTEKQSGRKWVVNLDNGRKGDKYR